MNYKGYLNRTEQLDPIRNTRVERTFHDIGPILERMAHVRKVRRGIKNAKVKRGRDHNL